jgi:peptidoglycan/xylan/chitin deacetylase (PgdA/CDA1 family)
MVALTFDCDSSPHHTVDILKILNDYDIKSTFFVTGGWTIEHPEAVQAIDLAGHEIGNHSHLHPYMTRLTEAEVISQLSRAEAVIEKVAGKSPRPLFRPPFGAYNAETIAAAAKAGYTYTVMWEVDTQDWMGHPAEVIKQRVMDRARAGSIVLMHVTGKHTVEALPMVIDALKAKGFVFGTASEILSGVPATPLPPAGVKVLLDGMALVMDVPGQLRGGRVLVPLRAISEYLGAGVDYLPELGEVRVTMETTVIRVGVTSAWAAINDMPVPIDTGACIESGRTLVPVRFVAEHLGLKVEWDEANQTVFLTRAWLLPPEEPPAEPQVTEEQVPASGGDAGTGEPTEPGDPAASAEPKESNDQPEEAQPPGTIEPL